ncbi:hypothetical protein Tco_1229369 [Tanacetum coccineum]
MTPPCKCNNRQLSKHNNIMASGSRDRPLMLAHRTRCTIGDHGPTYTLPVPGTTEDTPEVPGKTLMEKVLNMTPENKLIMNLKKAAEFI